MGVQSKCSESVIELGSDDLECILKKLSFLDILRFKRVCRIWSYAADTYVASSCYRPCFQAPWLLLTGQEEKEDDDYVRRGCPLSLFNLNEERESRDVFQCEKVYEGCHVGSSHGWLANLTIFNPFSGSRIQVGPLTDGWEFNKVDANTVKENPRAFVPRAVVMWDGKMDSDNDGIVLIYGSKMELAFSRFRDGRFMDLDGSC